MIDTPSIDASLQAMYALMSSSHPSWLGVHRGASSNKVVSEVGDAVSLASSRCGVGGRDRVADVPMAGKQKVVKIWYSWSVVPCHAFVTVSRAGKPNPSAHGFCAAFAPATTAPLSALGCKAARTVLVLPVRSLVNIGLQTPGLRRCPIEILCKLLYNRPCIYSASKRDLLGAVLILSKVMVLTPTATVSHLSFAVDMTRDCTGFNAG